MSNGKTEGKTMENRKTQKTAKFAKAAAGIVLGTAMVFGGIFVSPDKADAASHSKDLTGDQYAANMKTGLGIEGWNTYDAAGNPTPKISTKDKVVAIIDSGVDYNHEDLAGVMWRDGLKYKELRDMGGGECGINLAYASMDREKYDTKDPMDDCYHGTHMAGIIAGDWNKAGVSGMTSGAKIMAIKISHDQGSFNVLSVIKAYEYLIAAKKAGVNVVSVNCSLSFPEYSRAIDLMARKAGKLGIVSCFAAGNEGADSDHSWQDNNQYADNPYIVTVGASTEEGKAASFSNNGRRVVDVFAPGKKIMSTMPTSMGKMDENGPAIKNSEGKAMEAGFEDAVITDNKDNSVFGFEGKEGTKLAVAGSAHTGNKCLELTGTTQKMSAGNGTEGKFVVDSKSLTGAKGARGFSMWIKIPGEKDGLKVVKIVQGGKKIEELHYDGDAKNGWYNIKVITSKAYDLDPFNISLKITPSDKSEKALTKMYIDDVKLVDSVFAYKSHSGTSMATPAVTAGAAILSAAFPGDDAAKIAARIQGSVKPVKKMKDKSVSGGIFRVDKALKGKTNPVLRSCSTKGRTMTIKGYFFGKKKGSVTVDGKKCKVKSWKDGQIKAALPKKIKAGEKKIGVKASGKRSGHQFFRVKTPKDLFKRLPLPGRKVKGNPGVYKVKSNKFDDTFYSYSPRALVGAGGKLYYLMEDTKIAEGHHGQTVVYQYNIKKKKWKKMASGGYTPTRAACAWKGKIIYIANDEFNNETYISMFDPKKNKFKTNRVRKNGFEEGTELVNNGKQIIQMGGEITQYATNSNKSNYINTFSVIDPKKLTRKKLSGPGFEAKDIKAVADQKKNVYAITANRNPMDSFEGMYKLRVTGKSTKKTAGKMKAKKIIEKDLFTKMLKPAPGQTDSLIKGGPIKGGAIYSGPMMLKNRAKEIDADTYMFKFKNKKKGLVPTKKRVSLSKLACLCATTYRGKYYVIAQTNTENGKWVFTGVKVKTFAQPGDK